MRSGLGSHSTAFLCAITDSITSAMLHRQSNDDEQSNDSEQDRLHGYFWKYGPSARTLFSLYNGSTTPATLDDVINHALCRITVDSLETLVDNATGDIQTGQSNISHSIILVYPDPGNRSIMLVDVISHHVFLLIADALFKHGFKEITRAYHLFCDINPLSASAGWMFEYYCHRMLSEHEN